MPGATFRTAAAALLASALCMLALTSTRGDAASRPLARAQQASALRGVNITGLSGGSSLAQADHDIAWARALGANVVRLDIPWSVMEPQGPGQIDGHALAFTDRLTQDAAASSIRVIMMVGSTPCWASSAPEPLRRTCSATGASRANAWPPSTPADFATFAAYLASRYGPQLAAIEVWNEPDQINQQHFAGPNKARRYAAILRAAYPAIKQANAGVPVLGGSLVGSDGIFLRALYAAGIKGYYDGLAVHFYGLTLASLRAFRQAQAAAGDAAPLWLDEFGFSSCWPRYRIQQEQACVTRGIQAANLANLVRSLARAPWVAATLMYKLQGSVSEDFGLLTSTGSRKPAFAAFAASIARPLPSLVSPVRLALVRGRSGALARGSGPPGDVMRIEVFRGSLLRFWALFTLDRFNRYSIRLPSVLGASGLTVRVYQYWAGPAGAAHKRI